MKDEAAGKLIARIAGKVGLENPSLNMRPKSRGLKARP
jgi:hypothetical protein